MRQEAICLGYIYSVVSRFYRCGYALNRSLAIKIGTRSARAHQQTTMTSLFDKQSLVSLYMHQLFTTQLGMSAQEAQDLIQPPEEITPELASECRRVVGVMIDAWDQRCVCCFFQFHFRLTSFGVHYSKGPMGSV